MDKKEVWDVAMRRFLLVSYIFIYSLFFGHNFVLADVPLKLTAEQIIVKSYQLYRQTEYEKEEIEVLIQYYDGRQNEKGLTRWTKFDSSGEDKVAIKFSRPARDRGLGLLTWRYPDKGDKQWVKLPSLERVRGISASDQSKYFADTDITYEDARQLINEKTKDFNYILLRCEDEVWVIEALPKPGTETGYCKRFFWIDKRFVINKIEYFNKTGSLLKIQTNNRIHFIDSGIWRADCVTIDNRLLKRRTIMEVKERQIGINFASNIFCEQFLESERR